MGRLWKAGEECGLEKRGERECSKGEEGDQGSEEEAEAHRRGGAHP